MMTIFEILSLYFVDFNRIFFFTQDIVHSNRGIEMNSVHLEKDHVTSQREESHRLHSNLPGPSNWQPNVDVVCI